MGIPGGHALVGTDSPELPQDGEGPLRQVRIQPFRIGAQTVTNPEFAEFCRETGHVTDAERYGWSFVFWSQVPNECEPAEPVPDTPWWRAVTGAKWSAPNGPGTEDRCLPDHPVDHVSWNDAQTYCAWVGGRLPTEAEWEHAARGGLGDVRFPWGDAEPDDTKYMPCNIWQGAFPQTNLARDGYVTTAPSRSFEPNGFGLFNMAGNVWEWTAEPFRIRSLKRQVRERLNRMKGYKLSKCGSYLCQRSYCYRYRIAARMGTSPDTSIAHHGFRVVWDIDAPQGAGG